MLNIAQMYRERCGQPQYNTSYPLQPSDWAPYRADGPLPIAETTGALYLHIPFCAGLCRFCEYTRMRCPDTAAQLHYVRTLRRDVLTWLDSRPGFTLCGLDIGGGTPTVLCHAAFEELMQLYGEITARCPQTADFLPSIESTFAALTEEKIALIAAQGIPRISLGLQSASADVLHRQNRQEPDLARQHAILERLSAAGIRTVNLDLLYGLEGQTAALTALDLQAIRNLAPQQVTLYELRSNMLSAPAPASTDDHYRAYSLLCEGLLGMGYHGCIGQNTFSLNADDMGCSSYIRRRMTEACAYKGFGISAQSMSACGLSYNIGKNAATLPLAVASYEAVEHYRLPPPELAAKYMAIAGYCGRFSLAVASRLLGEDASAHYQEQLRFCLRHQLLEQQGGFLQITPSGFRHYGTVFSLFYAVDS